MTRGLLYAVWVCSTFVFAMGAGLAIGEAAAGYSLMASSGLFLAFHLYGWWFE